MKLSRVGERLARRHRMILRWGEDVVESIIASCRAVETGARNIDHIIGASLLPGLATTLLGNLDTGAGEELLVELSEEDGAFAFSFGGRP
jgi:type VI secretion system protein VasG